MSIGESGALVIVGALLRFALAWPPRYVRGGAVSIALWIVLLLTRHRAR